MTPAEMVRVLAEADARRMVTAAIEGERRRAERRARAVGGGRRVGEREHVVVAPSRTFRVVNGRCAGQVVAEDDTVECPTCEGRGEVRGSVGGDGYALNDWVADCDYCAGVGRVLGIPDESWQEPQRLQVLEEPSLAPRE